MMGQYEIIVIGASHGGVRVIADMLPKLSAFTSLPVLVVQHTKESSGHDFSDILNTVCRHTVREVVMDDTVKLNTIYLAPGGYHLLVELDFSLTLSKDDRVSFSRPSIDVLFESVADAYGPSAIACLLTGSNHDGAKGIAEIHHQGGLTFAQDPETAVMPDMPASAIKTGYILDVPNYF